MIKNFNSVAYQGICDSDDPVHDYERKAPLDNWDVRKMLRTQPPNPKNTDGCYIPEDAIDLIKALNENKTSIIPTCYLPETYYHISHRMDSGDLKIKVTPSKDEGWSRIEVDEKEGRLARDIFRRDFPDLFR